MNTPLPAFLQQTGPAAFTLTFSASGAYELELCEQLFSWRHVTSIEAAKPLTGRNYGKALHLVLQKHYAPVREPFSPATLLNDWFAANPQPLLDRKGKPEWRTATRALQAYEAYCAHYGAEDFEVVSVEEKFEVELAKITVLYRNNLATLTIRFHGLFDLCVRWHDQLWIFDTKYSTEWSDLKVAEGKASFQFMGYTWARRNTLARESQHAEPVAGVIGNYIISRAPYREGRKPTANDLPRDQFERQEYCYSESELAEWHNDAVGVARDIFECWQAGHWPRRRPACAHWGRCEFYRLCWETEPEYRLAAARGADYQPRSPSPFDDVVATKNESE